MSVELINQVTNNFPIPSDLELAEAQATILSLVGLLLATIGPNFGPAVAGLGTMFGGAAVVASNNLRQIINQERARRITTTTAAPTTTTTTTTTQDPQSKIFGSENSNLRFYSTFLAACFLFDMKYGGCSDAGSSETSALECQMECIGGCTHFVYDTSISFPTINCNLCSGPGALTSSPGFISGTATPC